MATLISGKIHKDNRGVIKYNNTFDLSAVKRMYFIENIDTKFIRCWQGHKKQQRWFSAVSGKFKIDLIKIDNWEKPTKELKKITFEISDKNFDVLHVPKGYVSSIQSLVKSSRLLVMADYTMNEIQDEFKFSPDFFK